MRHKLQSFQKYIPRSWPLQIKSYAHHSLHIRNVLMAKDLGLAERNSEPHSEWGAGPFSQ